MILDNRNENKKVHEWISEHTESGKMDIVTGYFTVGALSYLSKQVNEKITKFRFVLGDIVNVDKIRDQAIDLLNENITIQAALQLSTVAKEAVSFLNQKKVEAKTLEPNFCHAKTYIFKSEKNEAMKNYYLLGSSNLTEAGMGLKETHNIELNVANAGTAAEYAEVVKWFDVLWHSKEAHLDKIIIDEKGNKNKTPFKNYLIAAIEKIFIKYTPKELYYKVLFELFGSQVLADQEDPVFNRQVGRLENTMVYKSLYDFQQKGVLSLIKMLQKYSGAILADAVGLGKTWTALAVIKFFQQQGREIILICPKKLSHNWRRYLKDQMSRFEEDKFDYFMRFHTDLHDERMERYLDRADKYFTNEKPKLFVIDESHNLRNAKSKRYKFLVEKILPKNDDVKVLMLSATPINTSLIDIRNQFKLIRQGYPHGFKETHSIKNIDHLFRRVQNSFSEWRDLENPKIADFIKLLPKDFFRLTDSLVVARTRPMIEKQNTHLSFPKKSKPANAFITPKDIGNFKSFESLLEHFPPKLSGYQPTFYIKQPEQKNKLHDERQRDWFLVKMMNILLVKRLESSWNSFHSTVDKILQHHRLTLDKLEKYENEKSKGEKPEDSTLVFETEILDDDEMELDEGLLLGKRKISPAEIDIAGNLEAFKKDLKKDIEVLNLLSENLDQFKKEIEKEKNQDDGNKSKDSKLKSLMEKIKEKQQKGENNGNQKVIIFTVYKDTAFYLFDQLRNRGFNKIGVVTGDESKTDTGGNTKNFESILERFAPYTKLFKEKVWGFTPSSPDLSPATEFNQWRDWVAENDTITYKKLSSTIDILIATDVLSEGQNLQDCDMVINYDIHWNPVRVIQRLGRIDRIGSPNQKIFSINYWPSDNINKYLNLKGRVEERMTMMKVAGSEVDLEFTDSFKEMAENENFEAKMNEKMLKQMQTSWEDIEKNEASIGFDNLSLENYRQDLHNELSKNKNFYQNMPNGVYTGFKSIKSICPKVGLIALLGYPHRPAKALEHQYEIHELVYLDESGKPVFENQKEVLEALSQHKDKKRDIPKEVERGEPMAIRSLVDLLKTWITSQSGEYVKEDGVLKQRAGIATKNILNKLKSGDSTALGKIKQNPSVSVSDKYQLKNFDLITWFLVD